MEIKYKRPVLRIVTEVSFLDTELDELAGSQKLEDGTEQRMGILGIMTDKVKAEKFAPIWKKWCELTLENPSECSDFLALTGEEVLDIREGFFDNANPLKKRLAALRSSEVSEPKAT